MSLCLRIAPLALMAACSFAQMGCSGGGGSPVKGATFEQTVQQKFENLPAEKPTEKEITNSVGMKLLLVEPGSFEMGWPDGAKAGALDYEQFGGPVQPVTLTRPYYLGVTEVTQEQFQKVMGKNPSKYRADGEMPPADVEHGKLPVEQASWDDAMAFCQKLSEMPEEKAAGRVYTLPTEAQWEYACRAGVDTNFVSGDQFDPEFGVITDSGVPHPLEVGSRKPNPWGFYDMHGNVWEWCLDGRRELTASPVTDPTTANEQGKERIIRGGSFRTPSLYARSNFRNYFAKTATIFDFGFRVAIQR